MSEPVYVLKHQRSGAYLVQERRFLTASIWHNWQPRARRMTRDQALSLWLSEGADPNVVLVRLRPRMP